MFADTTRESELVQTMRFGPVMYRVLYQYGEGIHNNRAVQERCYFVTGLTSMLMLHNGVWYSGIYNVVGDQSSYLMT
jgi:hypothetical protein